MSPSIGSKFFLFRVVPLENGGKYFQVNAISMEGFIHLNRFPAETGYVLPLQTVQISWLLKKPTDLDLHCLLLSTCM